MLNNALYFSKYLYIFNLSDTELCSLWNQEDEAIIHLFANFPKSKTLWDSLEEFLKDTISLSLLTQQSAIFGFLHIDQELFLIVNYLLLLFKYSLNVSNVLKPFHFQPLKQILIKRIFWKRIFPNLMKGRKDFSSERGVKFRFISKLVINFSVGGAWAYFSH